MQVPTGNESITDNNKLYHEYRTMKCYPVWTCTYYKHYHNVHKYVHTEHACFDQFAYYELSLFICWYFWKPKGHVTYTNWYYKYVIDICMCSHLECSGMCTRRRPHTTEKFEDAVAVSSTAVYCHIFQQGYTANSILYRWMVYHSQAH